MVNFFRHFIILYLFSTIISSEYATALTDETKSTLRQLSYCTSLTLIEASWSEQKGFLSTANTLRQSVVVFTKVVHDYGIQKGLSDLDIEELNQQMASKIRTEAESSMFFDGPTLNKKNENCLDLIKNDSQLLTIWKTHSNGVIK